MVVTRALNTTNTNNTNRRHDVFTECDKHNWPIKLVNNNNNNNENDKNINMNYLLLSLRHRHTDQTNDRPTNNPSRAALPWTCERVNT